MVTLVIVYVNKYTIIMGIKRTSLIRCCDNAGIVVQYVQYELLLAYKAKMQET